MVNVLGGSDAARDWPAVEDLGHHVLLLLLGGAALDVAELIDPEMPGSSYLILDQTSSRCYNFVHLNYRLANLSFNHYSNFNPT